MATKEERIKEKRAAAIAKSKGTAGEPYVSEENYKIEIATALNWYSLHEDNKTKKKWVLEYLESTNQKEIISKVKSSADWEFAKIGALVRIISIGGYLSPEHHKVVEDKLNSLSNYDKFVSILDAPKKEKETKKPVREKYLDFCIMIDDILDEFVIKKSTNFNIKSFNAVNNINGAIAKKISSYYKKTLDEVNEALEGNDEQLNEGYSFFSKTELKKYRDLLASIVDNGKQVAVRKERKKKEKPVAVLVKDLEFLKEYPPLGMTCADVKNIIGASEVWLYNPSNKRMFYCKAADSSGLTVHRKFIRNFDTKVTCSKVIRKPEEYFKSLVMGKVAMREAFSKVNAKEAPYNGKSHPDILVLKVF